MFDSSQQHHLSRVGQAMHPWWLKLRAGVRSLFAFRSQAPLALFTAWFTWFIAAQYFIESSFIYRVSFYLLLAVFIALWVRQRAHVASLRVNFGMQALVALAVFTAMHALLIMHGEQAGKTLRDLANNSVFVLMALVMFRQSDDAWERLLRILVGVMAACAVLSLVHYSLQPETEYGLRLTPIGRAAINPLVGANMYGVALMIALAMYLRGRQSRWVRAALLLLIVLVPVMTVLSQSRGPMLAQLFGFGLALLLFRRYRLAALFAAMGVLAGGAILYGHVSGQPWPLLAPLQSKIETLLFLRDSMRLQVWDYTLELIAQRPWTGYGLRAAFVMHSAPAVVNPHNIFLSMAYYMGWPGLAFLLLPLAAAAVYAWRDKSCYGKLCLLLLAHGAMALFTDGGQAIKSPAPLWTLYWLPIAMAMARHQKVSVGQA